MSRFARSRAAGCASLTSCEWARSGCAPGGRARCSRRSASPSASPRWSPWWASLRRAAPTSWRQLDELGTDLLRVAPGRTAFGDVDDTARVGPRHGGARRPGDRCRWHHGGRGDGPAQPPRRRLGHRRHPRGRRRPVGARRRLGRAGRRPLPRRRVLAAADRGPRRRCGPPVGHRSRRRRRQGMARRAVVRGDRHPGTSAAGA